MAALVPGAVAAKGRPPEPGISIGYVVGSEAATGLGQAAPWLGSAPLTIVPATQVTPDPSLGATGVRAHVYGLFPAIPGAEILSRTALDALFSSGGKSYPFGAWSFSAGSPPRCSSNLAFRVPVTRGTVQLSLAVVKDGVTTTLPATFSTDTAAAAAKLRPGFYVLGLAPGTWSREMNLDPSNADWSHLSLVVGIDGDG